MSTATLNGVPVTGGSLQIPGWGLWWADLVLAEAPDPLPVLPAPCVLLIGAQTINGTLVSGGDSGGGSTRYRMVAGQGKWGDTIPAQGYANDARVKADTVIQDAARACGEPAVIVADVTKRTGPNFARPEGPASWALNRLEPENWYVDFEGVTHAGSRRPASSLASDFDYVIDTLSPDLGTVRIAVQDIAGLVPGVTVEGVSAVDVEIQIESGSIYATLRGARTYGEAGREVDALRALFLQMFPELRYRGLFEYRVVSQAGERLTLQPALASLGVPALERVKVRGPAGVKAAGVPAGAFVLVAFVNADPSRPEVIAFDNPESAGWTPEFLILHGATDFVALASLVDDNLGTIANAVKNHIHQVTALGSPTGPALSAPAVPLVLDPEETGSEFVKAD